jgi:hypothetical protein
MLCNTIKSLKPPAKGRTEVSDTKRAGLRFRLSSSGKAVWMYEKRVKGGPKRKHTLGAWPEPISLSRARALALEIEAEAAQGIDRVALAYEEQLAKEVAQSSALSVIQVQNGDGRLNTHSLMFSIGPWANCASLTCKEP